MRQGRITPPRVYAAISAITAELARVGIAKVRVNAADGYTFRGIDDVMKALAPLLAREKLCVLPRVLERHVSERHGDKGTLLISVSLKVAFDLVSARDGSMHVIEAFGEALDEGDKATAKAMSAAYKHALLQAFCIPVEGYEDGDASSHRLKRDGKQPDPVQGWEQWSMDICDIIRSCVSEEAVGRVQHTYRTLLRAASKRRPDVYAEIGRAVAERKAALARPAPLSIEAKLANGSAVQEVLAHA